MRLTDADRERIRELHAQRLTQRHIAKIVGCSKSSVGTVLVPSLQERRKAWRRDHRERHHELTRRWQVDHATLFSVRKAMCRARKIGVPYDRAIADELGEPPERCPVCGVVMSRHLGEGGGTRHNTPTIDRITPDLGYAPGNVQWLCGECNRVKGTGTMADLIARRAEEQ